MYTAPVAVAHTTTHRSQYAHVVCCGARLQLVHTCGRACAVLPGMVWVLRTAHVKHQLNCDGRWHGSNHRWVGPSTYQTNTTRQPNQHRQALLQFGSKFPNKPTGNRFLRGGAWWGGGAAGGVLRQPTTTCREHHCEWLGPPAPWPARAATSRVFKTLTRNVLTVVMF